MTKPLPRAVIFDWDNTLTDTTSTIAQAVNATRMRYGLDAWSTEQIKQSSSRSSRESFPEWFGDNADDALVYFYQKIDETHLLALTTMAGAEETLLGLRAKSVPLFVVSNKRGNVLREEVASLGWAPHFEGVVGAGDANHDKPSRDPVDYALSHAAMEGNDPSIWFVGDSVTDVATARASGCTSVYIGDFEEGTRYGADLIFADLHGMLKSLSE